MAMIRTTGYDRALLAIRLMTVELADAVQNILDKSLITLESPEQQEELRILDNQIDEARDRILNRIVDIMSLQQLGTQELRWMLGYQRMAQELERIADYACDIAELSGLHSKGDGASEILEMANHLRLMYEQALGMLKEEKAELKDLDGEDDELDQRYASLQKKIIAENDREDVSGKLGLAIILARILERLGDHVVNVGEMQVYVQTGQRRLKRQE